MNNNIKLRDWQVKFVNNEYASFDRKTQIEAGWYDWFCKDTNLLNKTKRMGNIIKQIKDGGKVDLDNNYVFFKNNCPLCHPLYDDFRICDISTGNVLFTITLKDPYEKRNYCVYGIDNKGEEHWEYPMISFDSSKELVKWLNTPWEGKN